ncbi:MAG: GNAT family N-acetyltransferase [Vulcanimicrobiaceae bacterium]
MASSTSRADSGDRFEICTERLRLRHMRPEDAEDIFEMISDPKVRQYLAGPPPESVDDLRQRIERHKTEFYEKLGFGLYVVEDRKTAAFVGRAGLYVWEIDGNPETEVTYIFPQRSWGKGYATEAAAALRDYGVDVLKKTRLVSLVVPENVASVKVLKKLGATLEKRIVVMGLDADMYVHSKPAQPSARAV